MSVPEYAAAAAAAEGASLNLMFEVETTSPQEQQAWSMPDPRWFAVSIPRERDRGTVPETGLASEENEAQPYIIRVH